MIYKTRPKLSGIQLYGVFLFISMVVFALITYGLLEQQAQQSIRNLEKINTSIKLSTAESYISQSLNNTENLAMKIASHQVVISTALGGGATPQEISDRLAIVKPVTGKHYIVILDILGDPIYQELTLPDELFAQLHTKIEQGDLSSVFRVFTFQDDSNNLMVALPILYNGFLEGLLVYVKPFDIDAFLSPLRFSEQYQVSLIQSDNSWGMPPPIDWTQHTTYLPRYDLDLVYSINPAIYQNNRNQFIRSLIVALSIAGALTYILVYFTGKKLLISPYQSLEKSERRLKKVAIEAQTASVAKSQFIASISHELRTPMNGVLGAAQLLTQCKNKDERHELEQTLLSSGHHMISILNDILDFSKIEVGKLTLNLSEFKLADLHNKIENSYRPLCLDKGITFEGTAYSETSIHLVADETRLAQIALNLLNNAWKFTQKGEIHFSTRLTQMNNNDYLEIKVSDTGIGIPAEKQATIFDPFTQGDGKTTRKFGGTGLGLTIISKLVDTMHGTLNLESKVGVGTRFIICVPVKVVSQPREQINEPMKLFNGEGLKALIVEDNRVNSIILSKFLKKRGFKCDIALDGQKGFEQASRTFYDVIMMDNHMPIMDGTEATKRIKALSSPYSDSIVIACTADAFEENLTKMREVGCAEIITKPVNEGVLDSVFNQYLSNQAVEKANSP
ncbi:MULTISPECIES: ATP-binding protein [Vibrio]|uniref:histidine kinase n=11 Tax=Vibrio TaxID=662 RepID=A0A2N7NFM6_9VIBR|nr:MULTISPECIES: ATP-binding protein [Vibrio]MCC4790281.1 response regulator [Vibrio splendidus]OEF51223.1 hybrid sensor histidine kinase/response regulator [Vibrio tasmaniensis 1F-267]OEF81230.1 hybrid sensor histidine kinase/response regulator [Vibrio tasmaniensis 1F-155]PMO81471.1 hybrid sensor histidine kinase/response regulator [Vibrio tasmaniensis]PMP12422.1 hybrid sensor histidine kinase/response regulator [Vibrio tasmaniensis]